MAVAVSVVVGAGLAWIGVALVRAVGGSLPRVGMVSWLSLLLLALGTGWLVVRVRSRLAKDRVAVDPRHAVRWLVWGKTSLLAGAAVAGAWLSFGLAALPGLPAPNDVERVTHATIAAVLSVGWAVAGWFVERACRVPPPDDSDDSPTLPEA